VSDEGLEKLRGLAAKYPSVAFLAITGSLARKGSVSTTLRKIYEKLSDLQG